MKISMILCILPAVAFAAPAPSLPQSYINERVKSLVSNSGSYKDCQSNELHYPAADAYTAAAAQACKVFFLSGEKRTGFGYRTIELEVPVYDSPTTRTIGFTYWHRNPKFKGQKFSEKECLKHFTGEFDGNIKVGRAGCKHNDVLVMRWGWKSKKMVDGRATIQFNAWYK